jgi:hypothetical protein
MQGWIAGPPVRTLRLGVGHILLRAHAAVKLAVSRSLPIPVDIRPALVALVRYGVQIG